MLTSNPFRGFRYPAEVIQHAVWLYHCFSLSLRDVELILAARGIVVSYESIRDWGLRFGRLFVNELKRRRPRPGDKWHLDEVFIRIRGRLHYLWRVVDQHGHVLDVLVQSRRSVQAAKRFFRKLLRGLQYVPRVIVTDELRSYGAAKREILPPPASNIGKAVTSTTGPRCRTSPRDDENGRCSGLSRHAMRSASSPPTAESTITSSFAATVSPPTNTVLLATKPFEPGAISPELPPTRELGICSGQFAILSLNLTAPSYVEGDAAQQYAQYLRPSIAPG